MWMHLTGKELKKKGKKKEAIWLAVKLGAVVRESGRALLGHAGSDQALKHDHQTPGGFAQAVVRLRL